MTAAQTREHEDDTARKHTEMKKENMRKVGSRHKKGEKIVLKASVATTFPEFASKPSQIPCYTIFHLRSASVGNGIKLFGDW